MKRILLVLAVASVLTAMMVATAMPAFAGLAKGQTNKNPGYTNDAHGDTMNQKCFAHGPDELRKCGGTSNN